MSRYKVTSSRSCEVIVPKERHSVVMQQIRYCTIMCATCHIWALVRSERFIVQAYIIWHVALVIMQYITNHSFLR